MPESQAETKRRNRWPQLDLLGDELQMLYSFTRRCARHLASNLNERADYPLWTPQEALEEDEIALDLAAYLAESDMPDVAKRRLLRMFQRRAITVSRIIGIISMMPADFVNRLEDSGYLTDHYVVDPEHTYFAELFGELIRYAEMLHAEDRATLPGALRQLRRPGSKVAFVHEDGGQRHYEAFRSLRVDDLTRGVVSRAA